MEPVQSVPSADGADPVATGAPAPDPVLVRMAELVARSHHGDRAGARSGLAALWDELGGLDADPFHRCGLAHALADLQDDPGQELRWDEAALAAAGELTDDRVRDGGVAAATAASLLPSLHLNLADVLVRLGRTAEARPHLALARANLDALPDDGYRRMISEALDRLGATVDGT